MTKEEIRLAAIDCLNESMVWKPYSSYEDAILTGFYDGVDWAQKQMQESNEGQALLYAVEKTAERTKREMIDKAADWIGNMVIEYLQGDVTHIFTHEMISDFRKAMQDENK